LFAIKIFTTFLVHRTLLHLIYSTVWWDI